LKELGTIEGLTENDQLISYLLFEDYMND